MLKKYFSQVPVALSLAVNFLLGWAASAALLFAAFAGILAFILFIFLAIGFFFLINFFLYLICKAVRIKRGHECKSELRALPLRAAAVFGTFVFMTGSFFWAGGLWETLNDWWF
ncbi:MAG: hypothetical protein K6B74_04835 [Ruminococcus sp.]|nr:hypothetical protein [Ruminococcus sp.]